MIFIFQLILEAHDIKVEIITAGDYMNRFCSTLSLTRDIQRAATIIAKRAEDLDLVLGRSPISVAAAAIYMASQVIFINYTAMLKTHGYCTSPM